MKNFRLNIDGKEVFGIPGQTILEVARENDIFIPTLCYDERTKIYGSCGLCMTEVEGNPKLCKACATQIADGMIVRTNTNRVIESRKTNLELLLSNHVGDCRPPCVLACPANTDCQGYVGLIANGEYEEAIKLIKDKIPLPAAIGRVCPHPCEKECRRGLIDEPIAIQNLKRFAADADLMEDAWEPEIEEETGKSVGIIGGGPMGLSAAAFLRQMGHSVTVFEAMPKAGGMLRYGIPEYRLPKEVLDQEIELIERMGVNLITNTKIGVDIPFETVKQDFDAVLIGIGAWVSTGVGCPGEDSEGVIGGIDFLRKVVRNEYIDLGEKVAIVGGGNTAMDAARAAKRAEGVEKVTLVYRRNRRYMPADLEELELAIEDGVEFMELASPVKQANGKLVCNKMKLGDKDASGRRVPVETGETVEVDADTVIAAVGEKVDLDLLGRYGIAADAYKKGNKKYGDVYVVGDASRGPATVADAIADAKWVIEDITGREIVADIPEEAKPDKEEALLRKMKLQMPGKCEADRCINCNTVCESCVSVCPNRANVAIAVPGKEMRQILHVDYMCNECGNCAHFCPYTDGRPYKDKFTLFANEKDFEDSENNGFMVVCTKCPKVKVRLGGAVKEYILDGKTGLGDLEDLMLTVIKEHGYLLG